MDTQFYNAKIELNDRKGDNKRRFRNILANSGEIMESGEIRDISQLYVMGYNSELYKISDLDVDPEKQKEKYAVKAQADHGSLVDGELISTIEKQFGSCKVWMEGNGLHARMYFANNDDLADHAWAISEDASYSTGIDWFPDGYYGAGYKIDEPIGILREVSMVLTGNDPRAKTIDAKTKTPVEAHVGSMEVVDDGVNNNKDNSEKEKEMSKTQDELTPEENKAIKEALVEVVDKFTEAQDSEEAPAIEATDTKDEAEEAPKEEEVKEEKKDMVHNNVVVIRDRVAKQEVAKDENWLRSGEARKAFADTLRSTRRFGASFDALWSAQLKQHNVTADGITGLPTATPVEQIFENAMEKSEGIISRFKHINAKSYRANILTADGENGRAKGHKKGDLKAFQEVTNLTRDMLCKMVYKKLEIDAMELYENPELLDIRLQELADSIIREIERAAFIGDGRKAPTTDAADYRLFDGVRGFHSISADASANDGTFGSYVAKKVAGTAGQNLYDVVVAARGKIKTEGGQYIVAKSSIVTALLQAKVNGQYVVAPGNSVEDILGVEKVYTPAWMEDATEDAFLAVNDAYAEIGENTIRTHMDFDTTKNVDIMLDETPRGGSLTKVASAVAITMAK